jgi:hypothetical protein
MHRTFSCLQSRQHSSAPLRSACRCADQHINSRGESGRRHKKSINEKSCRALWLGDEADKIMSADKSQGFVPMIEARTQQGFPTEKRDRARTEGGKAGHQCQRLRCRLRRRHIGPKSEKRKRQEKAQQRSLRERIESLQSERLLSLPRRRTNDDAPPQLGRKTTRTILCPASPGRMREAGV